MPQPQERSEPKPRRRVLVIDDEDHFCQYMSLLISSLGFEVETTPKLVPDDLSQLTTSDIIFVDMNMPGVDGIQVLDVLARQRLTTSIVLMSGAHRDVLSAAEAIAKQLGLRVVGKLSKPFRNRDIRRLLDEENEPPIPMPKIQQASEISIEDVLNGLARREFDAYFQPIINLSSGLPVGFEALARWRSQKFSLVTPDRFIAVAARNGVLPRLTRQIVHRSLGYAAALRQTGEVWHVAVNLGAEDLLDEQLPDTLANLVANHHLPIDTLTVELTESSATINEAKMLAILARMRLKGIGLAIDDFGTAHSNLERLSTIPFNSLKIDHQFIADMMTNTNARAIVEASIALAKRLRMTTVAEGIETESQLDFLKWLDCDFGQGYLFSRPMEFSNVLEWLSQFRTRKV